MKFGCAFFLRNQNGFMKEVTEQFRELSLTSGPVRNFLWVIKSGNKFNLLHLILKRRNDSTSYVIEAFMMNYCVKRC